MSDTSLNLVYRNLMEEDLPFFGIPISKDANFRLPVIMKSTHRGKQPGSKPLDPALLEANPQLSVPTTWINTFFFVFKNLNLNYFK